MEDEYKYVYATNADYFVAYEVGTRLKRIQLADGYTDNWLYEDRDGVEQMIHDEYIRLIEEGEMSNLSFGFGEALTHLKAGKKVARAGWNGKGMWIVLMPELYLPPFNTQDTQRKVNDRTAKFIGKDKPLDSQPYIAMWTAQEKWQPGWLASQADLLAEDWLVLEDGE